MREHMDNIGQRDDFLPLTKGLANEMRNTQDPAYQGSVIRILGEINRQNKPAIISKLLKILNRTRSHYLARVEAVRALGKLLNPENKKAIKELSKGLYDRDSSIREETVLALRIIRPKNMPKIDNKLLEMALNENEEMQIRIAAIETLGETISPDYTTKRPISRYTTSVHINTPIGIISVKNHSNQMILKIAKGLSNEDPDIRNAFDSTLKRIQSKDHTVVQQLKIQELYQKYRDTEERTAKNHPVPFGSWFEADIFLAIHQRGYFVSSDFEVSAGKDISHIDWTKPHRIDFVVFGSNGARLAIEYEGKKWQPTKEAQNKDRKREGNLEDFGWDVFRISEADFKSSPEQVLEDLWNKLNEMEIYPLQASQNFWYYVFSKITNFRNSRVFQNQVAGDVLSLTHSFTGLYPKASGIKGSESQPQNFLQEKASGIKESESQF